LQSDAKVTALHRKKKKETSRTIGQNECGETESVPRKIATAFELRYIKEIEPYNFFNLGSLTEV
jgi:hypothetical protein